MCLYHLRISVFWGLAANCADFGALALSSPAGRSAEECVLCWFNYETPAVNKTEWTAAEDERLRQVTGSAMQRIVGEQWLGHTTFVEGHCCRRLVGISTHAHITYRVKWPTTWGR